MRKAFERNDEPLGEDEVNGLLSSFFSSSLSLGEYAAPNGFGGSKFAVLGLGWDPLMFDWDGGVDPEENLELKFEIHEFRLIEIGLLPDFWGVFVSLLFGAPPV